MINSKVAKAMNEQIVKEMYSSYLYLQMAAWFNENNLPGFANWMKIQAQEELAHAMIFYNYIIEAGGSVTLGAIDKPPHKYDSALDVFEKTLEHEKLVTASINNIMDIAQKNKDYASVNRLNWFIDEQVEEEASASDMVGKLKLMGKSGNAIYMLDKELAARVYNTPSPLATA